MSTERRGRGGELKMANKLPSDEIDKIIKEFGKYGLRADEDIEHFTWRWPDGRKLFIPKQNEIPFQVNGRVEYIKTADYIRQLIKEQGQLNEGEKNN